MPSEPVAIILAAGKGSRMKSDLPKVVHPVAGEPMARWVVRACREAGFGRVVLVVGHKQDVVRGVFEGEDDVVFVEQNEQKGTGHAAMCAEPAFADLGGEVGGEVVVLAGDGPLVRSGTLALLLEKHRESGAKATLATSIVDDPSGYGRILRGADGRFDAIVEEKDATEAQRAVREINPSIYCFDAAALRECLPRLSSDNAKGEYYLTDVPGMLKEAGERVEVIDAVPPEDVLSINTPEQLAAVDRILRERLACEGAAQGGAQRGESA